MNKYKFKIGDTVEIIDSGQAYLNYEKMARTMKLKNIYVLAVMTSTGTY